MKFRFGEAVKVVNGFYSGAEGIAWESYIYRQSMGLFKPEKKFTYYRLKYFHKESYWADGMMEINEEDLVIK